MSIGRLLAWCVVALTAAIPLKWARLWIVGEAPGNNSDSDFLIATLICLGISTGLACFLVASARDQRRKRAAAAEAMQEIVNRPLTEISPTQALLKAGEKAYASAHASLHEPMTLGFTFAASGISMRINKGVTLRASGTRDSAVKGLTRVASGELVVSDQRVIFAGDNKSFAVPLRNLVDVTTYTDGFGLHDERATRILAIESTNDRMLFGAVLNKLLASRP